MADQGWAEFSGGGSVKWQVKHGKGEHGHGNPNGGNGRDKSPEESPGIFRVKFNDNVIASFPCRGTTLRIEWEEGDLQTGNRNSTST